MKAIYGAAAVLMLTLLPAGPGFAQTPPSPPAQQTAAPCTKPVASLYGAPLCVSEGPDTGSPALSILSQSGSPLLNAQQGHENQETLRELIWQTALVHKFGSDAVTPTAEEIESYSYVMTHAMDKAYAYDKQIVAMIESLLAKNTYMPRDLEHLKKILGAAKASVQLYEERETHTASLPPQYQFIVDSAQRQIASTAVARWKSDRALFRAYGGRLVFQGGDMVPLDAYAAFLKYIRQDAHLQIRDPAYRDVLKPTEDMVAAKQSVVPDADHLYNDYFDKPGWAFTRSNNVGDLAIVRQHFEGITTLGPKAADGTDENMLTGRRSLPPAAP